MELAVLEAVVEQMDGGQRIGEIVCLGQQARLIALSGEVNGNGGLARSPIAAASADSVRRLTSVAASSSLGAMRRALWASKSSVMARKLK